MGLAPKNPKKTSLKLSLETHQVFFWISPPSCYQVVFVIVHGHRSWISWVRFFHTPLSSISSHKGFDLGFWIKVSICPYYLFMYNGSRLGFHFDFGFLFFVSVDLFFFFRITFRRFFICGWALPFALCLSFNLVIGLDFKFVYIFVQFPVI